MLAFALEELRHWRDLRMRKVSIQSAAAMGIVGAISLAGPLLLNLTATGLFLLFGWMEGSRLHQSGKDARRMESVVGRTLFALVTWAFVVFVLSPALALSAIAWGLEPAALALCALSWLIAYLASVSVAFLSDNFVGLAALILWLGPPPSRRPSPFRILSCRFGAS